LLSLIFEGRPIPVTAKPAMGLSVGATRKQAFDVPGPLNPPKAENNDSVLLRLMSGLRDAATQTSSTGTLSTFATTARESCGKGRQRRSPPAKPN
jgi:hypothetical protein